MEQKRERKRIVKSRRGNQLKWDWDIIHALYIAGMEPNALIKLPEFKGLSKAYLDQKIYKEGWAEERKRVNIVRKAHIGMSFEERVQSAQKHLYEFMIKQYEDEMAIIKSRAKQTDIATQKERLGLLKSIWETSSKALGLEDAAPGDKQTMGFKMMFALQQGGAQIAVTSQPLPRSLESPTKALNCNSSAEVLESKENPAIANLEATNGVSSSPFNGYATPEELLENWRNDPNRIIVNDKECST